MGISAVRTIDFVHQQMDGGRRWCHGCYQKVTLSGEEVEQRCIISTQQFLIDAGIMEPGGRIGTFVLRAIRIIERDAELKSKTIAEFNDSHEWPDIDRAMVLARELAMNYERI